MGKRKKTTTADHATPEFDKITMERRAESILITTADDQTGKPLFVNDVEYAPVKDPDPHAIAYRIEYHDDEGIVGGITPAVRKDRPFGVHHRHGIELPVSYLASHRITIHDLNTGEHVDLHADIHYTRGRRHRNYHDTTGYYGWEAEHGSPNLHAIPPEHDWERTPRETVELTARLLPVATLFTRWAKEFPIPETELDAAISADILTVLAEREKTLEVLRNMLPDTPEVD